MRTASERFGRASAHHNRHAQGQRLLPALPRTTRCRSHDDDRDHFFEESRTAARYDEPDPDSPDVEDES
jgi:hypothetical protein